MQAEIKVRAAVLAQIALGGKPTDLAKTFSLSRPTIYRWMREEAERIEHLDDDPEVVAAVAAERAEVKRAVAVTRARIVHDDLGEIIYTLVEENIATLTEVARLMRDPDVFEKLVENHEASQMYIALADRTLRILQGYKPRNETAVVDADVIDVEAVPA